MKLLILLAFLSMNAWAQNDIPEKLKTNSQKIYALWSSFIEQDLDVLSFNRLEASLDYQSLTRIERLKLLAIRKDLLGQGGYEFFNFERLTYNEALEYLSHKEFFNKIKINFDIQGNDTLKRAKEVIQNIGQHDSLSRTDLQDLFFNHPDGREFRGGKYVDTARVFLLCRENRAYPCRVIIKDRHGHFLREKNGRIWSMPVLAKSKRGLRYNVTNGNTPTGIHLLDSVMPSANRQHVFGKFRRNILNWIPKSNMDKYTKYFLPSSHENKTWWKRASIARDVGRKYLRIHGTGRISQKGTTYYPHVPTSGCISTLEGFYDGVEYKGQRIILDKLMEASQLAPVYSNETNIYGVLYVVNIDEKKAPVSKNDLINLGIK